MVSVGGVLYEAVIGRPALTAQTDNRLEGRSNVFLTAKLDTGSVSMPVRIRNLSSSGALVEGIPPLPAGSKVRLNRGDLDADGDLVWQAAPLGGINFNHEIDVNNWIRRIGHEGQERVDGVVAAIRRAEPVPIEPQDIPRTESFSFLSAGLDQCCERLASLPDMSIEFAEELIRLESIAQSLRKLTAE